MRVLFVTPVEQGSGETITAVHMAEMVARYGGEAVFLGSAFSMGFIGPRFPGRRLCSDGTRNLGLLRTTVERFEPHVVVFADYPLLFFSDGVTPLGTQEALADELERLNVPVVTLDHTCFAQRPIELFFGPPHLGLCYEEVPPTPERLELLLPCPMHEPAAIAWRRGTPFRYWDAPLRISEAARREVRRRYVSASRDLLVFHSVPTWSWRAAGAHGLPYFDFLPQLLEHHLGPLAARVVLVSVNNGALLRSPAGSRLRTVNLRVVPVQEYERLVFSADLVITDNKLSITLGKAICGLRPCAALKNSRLLREILHDAPGPLRHIVLAMEQATLGSVYPYEVFPGGMVDELETLGLYRDNGLARCFTELEVFDRDMGEQLRALLTDRDTRASLRAEQEGYVERLLGLEDAHAVLERVVEHAATGR